MVVREASVEDATSLAIIGQCVWTDTYATEGVRHNIARYILAEFTEEKMLEIIERRNVFVLADGKHLIGYVVVSEKQEAEIETLYILPSFQGKGFGSMLLDYVLDMYGSVWLSCWERNDKAIEFYTKNGFHKAGHCIFQLDGEEHVNILLKYRA